MAIVLIMSVLLLKEMLYAVRCLKSNEDMILALAGQLKQLSHEPEKSVIIVSVYGGGGEWGIG